MDWKILVCGVAFIFTDIQRTFGKKESWAERNVAFWKYLSIDLGGRVKLMIRSCEWRLPRLLRCLRI
jgi:hypothetical protein